ncbi:MAG: quinone oxidoreductase family protein [Woeseiaceae bacterium]|jgi:NADPH2:quinone reductase
MSKAIRIYEFGGPEVLQWEAVDVPEPGEGEARIRHTAIGLNFIDVYHRTGLYPMELPSGLGREAAGVVEVVGPGVTDIAVGDRVIYSGGPLGSYADARTLDASLLVPIPAPVSDEIAAAVFLKGLTAWYLLHHSYAVKPGDPVLVYAAAGGVGSIATQWAKRLGAIVIGIAGTDEKAELAKANGCDHVLMADDPELSATVKQLTAGDGVAAVYDSVGKDTFMASLDCLRPHGTMVTYGNSSGAVEPFAPAELAKRGSLYVTRPILEHFIPTRAKLLEAADTLFTFIRNDKPDIRIGQTYALQDAAEAHRDLEGRKTVGSTVLLP